ncbi:hypothetical protein PI124_g15281 [Phytophthora idaei]|nr:hypothetical protein PI124_g15281 [Phytophthora idaei]
MASAWVVTILQAFVCLFLVVLPGAFAADDSVQLSDSFGGPHGTEFSDQASVAAGQTIGSITIRASERVGGISLEVAGPTAATFSHGGTGGTANTLALAKEEYITSMEAHWGEKKGRTRVFYLSFGTSAGNTVSGGSQTQSKNTVTAPKGFQLGGFFGLDGDEIDKLGAIWTRISAEAPATEASAPAPAPAPTPVPASAAASGSGVPAAESTAGSAAESALASGDDSASAEAPIKTKKKAAAAVPTKKKKAAAVVSSEGSDVGSTEDSALASGDDSASAKAPIKTKKKAAAAVPTKKKKAAAVVSSEGSDVGSTEDSALASGDDSASAEAPIKTKKKAAAAVPTKKKKAAAVVSSEGSDVGSTEDSALASGDDSASAEAPIKTKKKAAAAVPTKKKKAAAVVSSEGSDVGSTEDSALASGDDSASAEAPIKTKKKAAAAVPIKKKKKAAAASSEDSALASTDASGSAKVPTKKKKAAASSEGSAVGSTEESAVASAAGSAATSAESSAGSAAESTEGSAATAPTGSGDSTEGSAVESTAGSAAAPPAGSGPAEAPATPAMSVKDSIVLSESFGGPHGDDFSDKNFVNSGQKVTQISIYAGERLDGISMEISSPKTLTFTHGGTGGDRKVLKLGEGDAGNSLSGGSMTDDKSTVTAPEGFQLAGFFGKSGKEIDTLGAVWAYIDLVTPAPTPAPAPTTIEDSPGTVAPEDIAGSLSEVKTKANKRPVQLSDSFGGPHGEQFSDQLACTSGMTISSVTIRAGERLDGLTVQVSAPKEMTFTHGGTGGTENTLTLEPGEYITTMEVHWGQKSGHTRIFYMNLGTSKGNSVSGGSETKEKGSVTAPRGYQLAGFFGRYGDEMDLIGAVWSSIAAVNETSSTVKVSSEDDIALSELFGGPHGDAFSDINDIKFGQTISSIKLRSAKRVDAVTLKITAPIETVLNHGGRGGTEQMITLAADEYITSMEAHWDKKDKHTRVFYISFTTSAGQTIAGGTKTENSGTATAPDGFVLSGFYGRGGDEVDQIGAIWTRKTAKNVDLTDPSGLGNGTYVYGL